MGYPCLVLDSVVRTWNRWLRWLSSALLFRGVGGGGGGLRPWGLDEPAKPAHCMALEITLRLKDQSGPLLRLSPVSRRRTLFTEPFKQRIGKPVRDAQEAAGATTIRHTVP